MVGLDVKVLILEAADLVFELMDQKPDMLSDLINKLTSVAPLAVKMGFESAKQLEGLRKADQYAFLLKQLQKLRTSHDFKEGIAARMEKRSPNWKGE